MSSWNGCSSSTFMDRVRPHARPEDTVRGVARLPVGKLPSELLARLIEAYAMSDPTVVVGPGIGGDAAAIELGGTTLVVKSDPITFASESPGQYLVDVNANDLACLGATPRWMM